LAVDEHSTLISRIDSLLEASPERDDADVRAHMETTLTDGYAKALALEAEHWRLQRGIGAIAADLGEGFNGDRMEELAAFARRLALTQEELASLRETLRCLRDRLSLAARAA
jgi:hypothetical protein